MTFVLFLIFILFAAYTVYLAWYNSARQKGKRGERRVLAKLSQLPDEYTILNDLVFRTENGTTQIDHVVVSKYGIFTIETKNYRGEIYGDDNRQEWTQMIVTDVTYLNKCWKTYTYVTKNHFYNPVKQSLGHALRIKELLSAFPHVKIVPIVVFVGGAILNNINSRHHVVYERNLLNTITGYKTIFLNDNDVQEIVGIIEKNNIRQLVNGKQHVNNIHATARAVNAAISAGICPKCGGKLVERRGRYGVFYGCSNYPKCKFTKQ